MMKTDRHLYTISRTEFAKQIGKSREAVKIAMRRGKYRDDYIFENGKYFFKSQEGVRPKHDLVPLSVPSNVPTKRIRKRGNHDVAVKKGNYPNQAFLNYNARQRYLAAKGRLTPDQIAMVPRIEKQIIEEDRKQKQEALKNTKFIPSGASVSPQGIFNESRSGYPYTTLPNYYSDQRAYNVRNKRSKPKVKTYY